MNTLERPYNNQYLAELREFREEALVRSHWQGVRRQLGAVSFGKRFAEWQGREEEGYASLRDEGLRIGNVALTWIFPTVLKIFEGQATDTETLTFYYMDLRNNGEIAVDRRIIYEAQKDEAQRKAPYIPPPTKRRLEVPTPFDLDLLYEEMKRGASGKHPPKKYQVLGA